MHPVLPYILSSSDDMLIKLWDWEKVCILDILLRESLHCLCQSSFASTHAHPR